MNISKTILVPRIYMNAITSTGSSFVRDCDIQDSLYSKVPQNSIERLLALLYHIRNAEG